jgi:hypothetical protein
MDAGQTRDNKLVSFSILQEITHFGLFAKMRLVFWC